MKAILQPFSEQRLGDLLKVALNGQDQIWSSFQAAVAFAKRSGVAHLQHELQGFVDRGGHVRMVVGIDQYGTSIEALSDLLNIGDKGEIWINHDSNNYITFHPKVYLFEAEISALLIVGSGNLTEGGLYTNDEASLVYELDLSKDDAQTLLSEVKEALDKWCNNDLANVRRLDAVLLQELAELDYIRPEAKVRTEDEAEAQMDKISQDKAPSAGKKPLFGQGIRRRRPTRRRIVRRPEEEATTESEFIESDQPSGFVMTLMRTDVGAGQTTPGTSRRSPEIFIPLAARNMYPAFWDWPDAFTEDLAKPGKFDRSSVPMRVGGEVIRVNMMTWPDKHDFRLRSEALRSAGHEGDILRIEKTSSNQDFAYYVEIIPAGTSAYEHFLDLCVNRTPHSRRRWGYYE